MTVAAPTATPQTADRNALWRKVHDICAVKAKEDIFPPSPCIEVHGGFGGYAIFKDQHGPYQYLLIPSSRISGIESPKLLHPDTPNYFALAWNARGYVERAIGRKQPRDVMSLVLNSSEGRSQDQLHIHVDCIRKDVHDAIAQQLPNLSEHWVWLPGGLPPNGHRYMARRLNTESLSIDPVKDLSHSLPPGDHLSAHSIVVVGVSDPTTGPGFVLLSGRVDEASGDRGNADDLQDTACFMAQRSEHP
ncbi:MAG TPA: CDP-diacylglycerol diphosphatase [Dyella sp.]|nr:CDP-diacylglycerol diphosphatase [Dyella sp.]